MASQRVAHLTSVHPPFDNQIFHKECKTLVQAGYDVWLVATHNKNEFKEGVQFISLPRARNRLSRITTSVKSVFSKALQVKADLYHFHDPELIPAGLILKFLTGKKVIYDVHEDYGKQTLSKEYISTIFRSPLTHIMRNLEYLSSRYFDGIIAATDDILTNFFHHRHAISLRNFPRSADFPSIRRKKKDEWFRVIFIGLMSEARGISQIIQAMRHISKEK